MPPAFFVLSRRAWKRLLLAWFFLATCALLVPLPEGWHSLEASSAVPLDKLAHALGTFIGGLLAHHAGWSRQRNLVVWALYAGGMEIVQAMMGLRAGDWLDFLSALLGLGAAVWVASRGGLWDRQDGNRAQYQIDSREAKQ